MLNKIQTILRIGYNVLVDGETPDSFQNVGLFQVFRISVKLTLTSYCAIGWYTSLVQGYTSFHICVILC